MINSIEQESDFGFHMDNRTFSAIDAIQLSTMNPFLNCYSCYWLDSLISLQPNPLNLQVEEYSLNWIRD